MMDNLREYCVNAKKITNEQESYLTGILVNDIFHYFPMLWISYTHIYLKNNARICTGSLLHHSSVAIYQKIY